MGMTFDEALDHLYTYSSTLGSGQTTQDEHEEAKRVAIDTMCKYQQLRADYENRLKADMVAMLTEIQLEIEELQGKYSPYYDEASQHTSELIQQKIDKLKGERDDADRD